MGRPLGLLALRDDGTVQTLDNIHPHQVGQKAPFCEKLELKEPKCIRSNGLQPTTAMASNLVAMASMASNLIAMASNEA